MEHYLYKKKFHLPPIGKNPDLMWKDEWKILNYLALGVIQFSLVRNVIFNIMKEKMTANLLKALENVYEKPSITNKVFLICRLFDLEMSYGGYVTNHINDLIWSRVK